MSNKLTTLPGDFVEGFSAEGARMTFDALAQKMARIVEIIAANPDGLAEAALAEVDLLARLAGLKADHTASDVGADLNDVWGVLFVAYAVEAQALAAIAIDKAGGR